MSLFLVFLLRYSIIIIYRCGEHHIEQQGDYHDELDGKYSELGDARLIQNEKLTPI